MLEKNITIKGIFTAILFVTLGFTQVSLEIKNVDLTAGTLDIYMTNVASCSYCTDATYPDEGGCILYGSVNNNGVFDATWELSTDIDAVTCAGECSTGTYTDETSCTDEGTCSDNTSTTKTACEEDEGTWEPYTWTDAATNGVYFNGKVGGFQFQLFGATIDLASGGSAADNGFTVSTQAETYNSNTDKQLPNILAFSLTGATIPVGLNSLLTRVTFTTFLSSNICFGEDTGSAGANTISDAFGGYIAADWGGCYCGPESQNDADGDSICDDDDTCPYDEYNDADGDGVCGDEDVCAATAAGAAVDDNGCSESQNLSISQVGNSLPAEFSITQNFPNPFNPVTSITFDVAEMDDVSLVVYDLIGKEVATLVSGTYAPGTYNVEWNAVNNAGDGIVSGMYIYRYISSEKAITRKMLYLK